MLVEGFADDLPYVLDIHLYLLLEVNRSQGVGEGAECLQVVHARGRQLGAGKSGLEHEVETARVYRDESSRMLNERAIADYEDGNHGGRADLVVHLHQIAPLEVLPSRKLQGLLGAGTADDHPGPDLHLAVGAIYDNPRGRPLVDSNALGGSVGPDGPPVAPDHVSEVLDDGDIPALAEAKVPVSSVLHELYEYPGRHLP